MTDSILDSVKEALGVPVDQPAYDAELIMHINSVLSTLNQIGVGPVEGFMITDKNASWADFLGPSLKLNYAQTYMYLSIKLIFDPPQVSFVIDAFKERIQETAYRLSIAVETSALPIIDVTAP